MCGRKSLSVNALLGGVRAGHTYVSSGPGLYIGARGADGVQAKVGEILATHRACDDRRLMEQLPASATADNWQWALASRERSGWHRRDRAGHRARR